MDWTDVDAPPSTEPQADKKYGEFFKFTEVGQVLEGVLKGKREGTGKFGPEVKYDIETADGLKTVTAGKDLREKLAVVPVGTLTRITLAEEIPLEGRDFPFKKFKVQIAKARPAQAAPF